MLPSIPLPVLLLLLLLLVALTLRPWLSPLLQAGNTLNGNTVAVALLVRENSIFPSAGVLNGGRRCRRCPTNPPATCVADPMSMSVWGSVLSLCPSRLKHTVLTCRVGTGLPGGHNPQLGCRQCAAPSIDARLLQWHPASHRKSLRTHAPSEKQAMP